MKKSTLYLFLTLLIASILCISASAEIYSGSCGDNVTWSLDTTTGHLDIRGSGAMYDYDETPGALKPSPWKTHQYSVKSASIGEGITYIGNYSFYYISSLIEVTLPSSLKSIGTKAFSYCTNLNTVELPEGLLEIGDFAFSSCYQMRMDKLPSTLTEMGECAFNNCDSLIRITIPSGVSVFRDGAFSACDLLEAVLVTNKYSTVQKYPFTTSPKLTVYSDSGNVNSYCMSKSIPCKSTYYFPTTEIELPLDKNATDGGICGGNTYWNYYQREGKLVISGTYRPYDYEHVSDFGGKYVTPWSKYADSITTVEIKEGVTGLGEFCLSELKNLTDVHLSEGLKYLGMYAFYGCKSLTSIELPKSFKTGYFATFTKDLKEVYGYKGSYAETFAKDNGYTFVAYDDYLFGGTVSNTISWSLNTKTGELKLEGSGAIPNYEYGTAPWYEYRYSIITAKLSDKITAIGNKAFYACENLIEINIHNTVKSFGDSCFAGCNALKEIYIPEGTLSIMDSTFSGCRSIKSIYIPDGVTTIGNHAFNNCNALSKIRIPDSVRFIGLAAFNGTAITSFTIPQKVTTISFHTFANCQSLGYINVHKNVTSIDSDIFYKCEVAICGYKGSYAETYAKANNITFIDLEGKRGDVNGDETIDLKDVTTLRRYLAGGYKTAVAETLMDVNADGKTDLKDVTALRRYLAGGYGVEIE